MSCTDKSILPFFDGRIKESLLVQVTPISKMNATDEPMKGLLLSLYTIQNPRHSSLKAMP
jgi:hypothetical protein